jgi:isopentenyl phosphate kinase
VSAKGPPARRRISSEPAASGEPLAGRREVVLVKWGGSLLTDKTGEEELRPDVLARLANELVLGAARAPELIVLGHGSGSFGHRAAHRGGLGEPPSLETAGARRRAACDTQDRAAALHRHVVSAVLAAGGAPFSFSPSSTMVTSLGAVRHLALAPLATALAGGLLPVSYGDVVLDEVGGAVIVSTERLFALLAEALPKVGYPVRRILWLGATAGVHDRSGRLLPQLDPAAFAREHSAIVGAQGVDVTGGMRHRVETALALSARGISSLIANGEVPGLLAAALAGETVPGTQVAASA